MPKPDGLNGYDPGVVSEYVLKLEELKEDLNEEARQVHARMADVLKEAKKAGIPQAALKMLVKRRAFEVRVAQMAPDNHRALRMLEAALAEYGDGEPEKPALKPTLVTPAARPQSLPTAAVR